MGMAPDSSVYPRVLCLAAAYAPARSLADGAAAAVADTAGTDSSPGRGAPATPRGQAAAAQLPPLGERIERVLRELDSIGVRQVVVCARPARTPRLERLGDWTLLRRIGRTGPAAPFFPIVAGRSLLLLARTADVVHLHHAADFSALPLALVTARAWDLPLVLSIHESHLDAPTPADPTARLRLDLARRLERAAARGAAAVVVPTHALAERLAEEGVLQRRIHVIPAELKESDAARQLLGIYGAAWARYVARSVAIWHPTAG